MAEKFVGLIELSSIAAGFQVADTILKAGDVRLFCRARFAPANTWCSSAAKPLLKPVAKRRAAV